MNYYSFLIIAIIFSSLYFFLSRFPLLKEDTNYSIHKNIGKNNKNPIVLGGIYFLIVVLVLIPNLSIVFKSIIILLTFLGILSDKNILPSPKIRLLIQIFLLLFLVLYEGLNIYDLKIDFLNSLLSLQLFNLAFIVFCLAILINGSNFIDGLNGLLTGYYLVVLISLFILDYHNDGIFLTDKVFLKIIFFSLLFFFIFNLLGHVYLGDSGSYLISLLIGVYLINFYSLNSNYSSPYYIASLLWYPAFENFYSLSRRILIKQNLSTPDNHHLHQLFFLFLKNNQFFRKKNPNTISGTLIVIFNIPSMIISTFYASHTKLLVAIILLNILLYCLFYYILSKKLLIKK